MIGLHVREGGRCAEGSTGFGLRRRRATERRARRRRRAQLRPHAQRTAGRGAADGAGEAAAHAADATTMKSSAARIPTRAEIRRTEKQRTSRDSTDDRSLHHSEVAESYMDAKFEGEGAGMAEIVAG